MTTTILIVEDEQAIADSIAYALRTDGFTPVHVSLGQHALDAMGYSDQLGTMDGAAMLASQERFIRKEVATNSGASLLKKLEGKS